jgi:hypothetical protein
MLLVLDGQVFRRGDDERDRDDSANDPLGTGQRVRTRADAISAG